LPQGRTPGAIVIHPGDIVIHPDHSFTRHPSVPSDRRRNDGMGGGGPPRAAPKTGISSACGKGVGKITIVRMRGCELTGNFAGAYARAHILRFGCFSVSFWVFVKEVCKKSVSKRLFLTHFRAILTHFRAILTHFSGFLTQCFFRAGPTYARPQARGISEKGCVKIRGKCVKNREKCVKIRGKCVKNREKCVKKVGFDTPPGLAHNARARLSTHTYTREVATIYFFINSYPERPPKRAKSTGSVSKSGEGLKSSVSMFGFGLWGVG